MKEPPIRIEEEFKIGLKATEEKRSGEEVRESQSLGLPGPTPKLEEITGTAEGDGQPLSYAAALDLFRPPIGRFDRR